MFGCGDGLLGEEFVRALRIHPRLVRRGSQCFPIVFGRFDLFLARPGLELGQLGGGLVAFGAQLGGGKFGNRAAGLQNVSFLRQDAFHPATVARRNPDLVGLNGAGNAWRARRISHGTAGGQERQRRRRAQDKAELGLHAVGT